MPNLHLSRQLTLSTAVLLVNPEDGTKGFCQYNLLCNHSDIPY